MRSNCIKSKRQLQAIEDQFAEILKEKTAKQEAAAKTLKEQEVLPWVSQQDNLTNQTMPLPSVGKQQWEEIITDKD